MSVFTYKIRNDRTRIKKLEEIIRLLKHQIEKPIFRPTSTLTQTTQVAATAPEAEAEGELLAEAAGGSETSKYDG